MKIPKSILLKITATGLVLVGAGMAIAQEQENQPVAEVTPIIVDEEGNDQPESEGDNENSENQVDTDSNTTEPIHLNRDACVACGMG